jgi:hypothetical protein
VKRWLSSASFVFSSFRAFVMELVLTPFIFSSWRNREPAEVLHSLIKGGIGKSAPIQLMFGAGALAECRRRRDGQNPDGRFDQEEK